MSILGPKQVTMKLTAADLVILANLMDRELEAVRERISMRPDFIDNLIDQQNRLVWVRSELSGAARTFDESPTARPTRVRWMTKCEATHVSCASRLKHDTLSGCCYCEPHDGPCEVNP